MTPRQADIAFVLEGVPGVREVYALERGAAGDLEIAVRTDPGGRPVALAHYALLRVLTHEECNAVLFFDVGLAPYFSKRASRLELSDTDREAARARAPLTSAALEQEPAPTPPLLLPVPAPKFRILIVDADADVYRIVVPFFGGEGVIETNSVEAFAKADAQFFSLILCDARLAFGGNGFLRMLHDSEPARAARVLLVAHEGERDLLVSSLVEHKYSNRFLCRPIEVDALYEVVMKGDLIQRWSMPVLRPRKPATVKAKRRKLPRRVLVVDDDPETAILLASKQGASVDATVTSDEWEALDHIAAGAPDLVVCSVSLRTRGGTPFYRLLWNAHPELKHRFVLIARAEAAPASTTSGRAAPVVERPLTRDVIAALLERFKTS